jgi:hypothetical protein
VLNRQGRSRLRLVGVLALAAAVVAVVAVLALGGGGKSAPRPFESIFQDDQYLLYSPDAVVARTLDVLRSLGVDRLRLTILWAALAPDPLSRRRPGGFAGGDPAAYPAPSWVPYDRVVKLARARGIGVDFNLTAPGPLWAMGSPAPNAKAANHYLPSASAFGQFVAAVGRRYSGSYRPSQGGEPLPRVSFWTIWNEPNQPGWLWPQWRNVAGTSVMASPSLYRAYVDAASRSLSASGHTRARDTILIGELAPEGRHRTRARDPIPPMPFLRALYCVDSAYRPLRGSAAAALQCARQGAPSDFVAAHPGLFDITGFAHHPYSFFLPPSTQIPDPTFVPLSDLRRLEVGLDRIFAAYGASRTLPIWLTEYGYETNPPDPFRGVSPKLQAAYLDEAQYMAWQDPRVRGLAQFLLVDSAPDPAGAAGSQTYWSTFQTGLFYLGGRPKLSYNAYRLPIWLPQHVVSASASTLVWGMLRPARGGATQAAQIQWRPTRGGYRTLAVAKASGPGAFISAHVTIPGTGAVRIAWPGPGGGVLHSRAVGVTVR